MAFLLFLSFIFNNFNVDYLNFVLGFVILHCLNRGYGVDHVHALKNLPENGMASLDTPRPVKADVPSGFFVNLPNPSDTSFGSIKFRLVGFVKLLKDLYPYCWA